MSIDERAHSIVKQFSQYSDWEDRYRELIKIGKNAEVMPVQDKIDKFLVKGCQSLVWLKPSYTKGVVEFKADSDAVIVKGIVCLLVNVFSGATPEEILKNDISFLSDIGITEHLSMNRTNGLASMVKQIKMYGVVYKSLADKGILDAP